MQKFYLVLISIARNFNAIAKHTSTDLTLDERTWDHRGHGTIADSLKKKIEGKLNVTKGGQLAMSCNVKSLLPREYVCIYKLRQQERFTQEGP